VNVGWDPDAMLRSAQLQMARRRKSGMVEPIGTLGYFEREFRKVFGGIRVGERSPPSMGSQRG
jgi:hypothetical protein